MLLKTSGNSRSTRPVGQFSINRSSPQLRGLLHWFPFADQLLFDAVFERSDTAIVVGAPTIAQLPTLGKAAVFTGSLSAQAIRLGIESRLDQMPLTICGWAKLNSAGLTTNDNTIIAEGKPGGLFGPDYAYMISLGAGTLNVYTVTPNTFLSSTATIPVGRVVHWAVTLAPSDCKLYVDGQLSASRTSCQWTPAVGNDHQLHIGDRADDVFSSFDGLLADVRIYNRILDANEIWQLYAPATRWDAYLDSPIDRTRFFIQPTTVPTVVKLRPVVSYKNSRPPFSFTPNENSQQADGLVGWWPLRGMQDSYGKSPLGFNQLTPSGVTASSYTSSPFGTTVNLGATDFYSITAPVNMPALDAPKTISMFWKYPDAGGRRIGLAMVKDDTSVANNSWSFEAGSSNKIAIAKWGDPDAYTTAASFGGVYQHVTFTYDSAGVWRVYVDGQLALTGAADTSQTGPCGIIRIGSFSTAFPTPYWNGPITEVRIWNRTLTSGEVWDLYNPATRWDLYASPNRYTFFDVASALRLSRLTILGAG